MRVRLALPSAIVNERTLGAALEAATVANEGLAARGQLPDIFDALRKRAVKWQPEPFSDGEHFDLATTVVTRGWGDCDDLAPWLAATLRQLGHDARAVAYKSGPERWHAIVKMADGKTLDPSQWFGMKRPGKGRDGPGVSGKVYSQIAAPMQDAIALLPYGNGWCARADTALDDGRHIAFAADAKTPQAALAQAVAGYAAYTEGCYGGVCGGDDDEVGSFLSDIVSTVAPVATAALGPAGALVKPALDVATPLASNVLKSLMPGGAQVSVPPAPPPGTYGPGAVPARSPVATASIPPIRDGRPPGMVSFTPGGGPIIVRF